MMRSLWTAASGMTTQQLNIDTISHNISNVNTTAYKSEKLEFKSLLYQTLQRASLDENATGQPVNLQVGHGVRPIVSSRQFTNGAIERTDNPLDMYLEGEGFFVVDKGNDNIAYTKDGSFKASYDADADEFLLVTSEGYRVLDVDGEPITFPTDAILSSLEVAPTGELSYTDAEDEFQDLGVQIAIVQFPNVQGLEAIGDNLYVTTTASGEALYEADGDTNTISSIIQSCVERSNVNVANEMINMIIAQRAYELNSKAIQTSDDMLQQAASLKR